MIDIETNLASVKARIQKVSTKNSVAEKPVLLVAVSKKQPPSAIAKAISHGQRHFGENYLAEALDKIAVLARPDLIWHFLGPVQSNKTRAIASHFNWVHSIDRMKIAQRLSDQRCAELPPLNICIQVNIDGDPAKSGIPPASCRQLAEQLIELPNLSLRGLMVLPAIASSRSDSADSFFRGRELFDQVAAQIRQPQFNCLSMGMSQDLDAALQAGANIVRIGTAIFGARSS